MIQIHNNFNIDDTNSILESCGDAIAFKECYNNVFNVITYGFCSKFHNGEWKVTYGYVSVFDNIMARHCFILDENNNVIDPTLMKFQGHQENRFYVSFAILEFDDYMDKLEQNDLQPALFRVLRNAESEMINWSNENMYVLCG